MSREPTRHQLSSKLAYEKKIPAFLVKLQRKIAGHADEEDEEDYDGEFEDDGSGRPPIPRRPAIPERPDEDPGSAEEDGDDEAPQVVVLKQGKHLSEREAQNEKRKAMGLPPLVDLPVQSSSEAPGGKKGKEKEKEKAQGMTFSSGGKPGVPANKKKRKLVVDQEEGSANAKPVGTSKKKVKKSDKKLLSFGDDDP